MRDQGHWEPDLPQSRTQEAECAISQRDWNLLQRVSEAEKERGHRNLFAGIAITGAVGTSSTLISHFEHLFVAPMGTTESALLVLMTSATLAASALAAFFHQRVKKSSCREAYRQLRENIQLAFEYPRAAGDPRQWP